MKIESLTPETTLKGTKPLIRWAGGKRLILSRLQDFLPKTYGTYFEPMLGSGALFFALNPKRAVLADVNPELINFYQILRSQPRALYSAIRQLRASKRSYYYIRGLLPSSRVDKAARFFYLIRLSWNGIYRVNKQGKFNVPFGGRKPKELVTFDAIEETSRALKTAHLLRGEFEDTTATARAGDLVYLDPPYPKGAVNGNGFARYSQMGFTVDDHKQLAKWAAKLADLGVHVIITEAARSEFIKLYSRSFHRKYIRTYSLIAAESEYRRQTYEVILTSYRIAVRLQSSENTG